MNIAKGFLQRGGEGGTRTVCAAGKQVCSEVQPLADFYFLLLLLIFYLLRSFEKKRSHCIYLLVKMFKKIFYLTIWMGKAASG